MWSDKQQTAPSTPTTTADQTEVAALLDQLRGLIQSAKPGNEGPDEDGPSGHLVAV